MVMVMVLGLPPGEWKPEIEINHVNEGGVR